jgi:DNA-binding MarR family transcriptional regulator
VTEGQASLRPSARKRRDWARRPERVDLGQTIVRLRRALRRAIARRMDVEALPDAQVELVQVVDAAPGIRVNDAAVQLAVAGNTVSTLVSRLVSAGILERTPDPSDGRGGCLNLTAAGQARVTGWRIHRAAIIEEALAKLGVADGAAIEAALPALWRLSRLLEALDDSDARGDSTA